MVARQLAFGEWAPSTEGYFVMEVKMEGKPGRKDPLNCPFCEAEEKGYSEGWGFSPEGWEEMEKRHLEEHCIKCPICEKPTS